jgi:hypothetical protein
MMQLVLNLLATEIGGEQVKNFEYQDLKGLLTLHSGFLFIVFYQMKVISILGCAFAPSPPGRTKAQIFHFSFRV